MENKNVRYCLACGYEITEDYGFCPACGYYYETPRKDESGSSNVRTEQNVQQGPTPEQMEEIQRAFQQYAEDYRRRVLENQHKANLFMLGIWCILSGIMSLALFTGNEELLPALLSGFGFGNHELFEAVTLGCSFIFVLISLICCALRKYWIVALASCLLSAFSTLALIYHTESICVYLFLFGLLASLRIKNSKVLFTTD